MDKKNTYSLTIYSDGSSLGNPGPGGWGYVCVWLQDKQPEPLETHVFHEGGFEEYTTNNRMELAGLLGAYHYVKRMMSEGYSIRKVTFCLDSTYVLMGTTVWMANWIQKKWRNSESKPVANKDLWLQVRETEDVLKQEKSCVLEYTKVSAHSGVKHNESADTIARTCAVKQESFMQEEIL